MRMDPLLRSAVEQLLELDPEHLLEVLATPETEDDLEELAVWVERLRGRVLRRKGPALRLRIPAGEVEGLAGSGRVRELRLARTRRAH